MSYRNVWENSNQSGSSGNNSLNQSSFSSPRSGSNNNFFSQSNFSSQKNLTPEQVAFENEFTKWETSFAEWKRAYADHPDQSAYREYEKKFMDIRDKLLIKRQRVYNSSNAHSEFEAHLHAASSMAEQILNNFDESPPIQNRFSQSPAEMARFNSTPYQHPMQSNMGSRFKKSAPQSTGCLGNFQRSSSLTNPYAWKNTGLGPAPKQKKINPVGGPQKGKGALTQPITHTVQDIEQKFEEARKEIANNECPRFSGASRRKFLRLKEQNANSYNAAEKRFMDYSDFVQGKRNEFLVKKRQLTAEVEATAVVQATVVESQAPAPQV